MIEDTDKLCAVLDVIVSKAMSSFTEILWPLLIGP